MIESRRGRCRGETDRRPYKGPPAPQFYIGGVVASADESMMAERAWAAAQEVAVVGVSSEGHGRNMEIALGVVEERGGGLGERCGNGGRMEWEKGKQGSKTVSGMNETFSNGV